MKEGDYIEGETVEGEYYAPGDPIPRHSERFDRALQSAVDNVEPGEPEWFEVRFMAHVRHSSPGWVDGYSVRLVQPGG